MIKAMHYDSQAHTFQSVTNLEEISDLLEDKKNQVWLDLDGPDKEHMHILAEEFKFHPLAVEDALTFHQRPKIEEYENFFFVVFYTARINEKKDELRLCELKMFVGSNYLVTVHHEELSELKDAEQRWRRNVETVEHGIGVLLYSLLDTVVDNYFPIVDELVDQAEEMEDAIFQGMAGQRNFTEDLLGLKKLFLRMRRVAGPERDVLNVLTNRDSPVFNETNLVYFRDVYDHLMRLSDTLDLYRDQISSAMDANLAVVSNDLNKVMRTLTATSIILMSDALVSGIYGMNFDNIPELHLPYGYFGALALMLGVSVGLYFFFKKLRWF